MRMIRGPCGPCSLASSAPCSRLGQSREQFHWPGAAARHAAAERSAPTVSRALQLGNRKPPPGVFEANSSFTLSEFTRSEIANRGVNSRPPEIWGKLLRGALPPAARMAPAPLPNLAERAFASVGI